MKDDSIERATRTLVGLQETLALLRLKLALRAYSTQTSLVGLQVASTEDGGNLPTAQRWSLASSIKEEKRNARSNTSATAISVE